MALVTGAASGMGLATARAFAEAGAAVGLADLDKDAAAAAAKELTSHGHPAIGVACDVTDESQAAAMVEQAVTKLRPPGHGVQQRRDPAAAQRRGPRDGRASTG